MGGKRRPVIFKAARRVEVDVATGKLVNATEYMGARLKAANAGSIYNPTLGWTPVAQAHSALFNIDYGNVAPRVSFAWNPESGGLLGSVMGSRKTVIRGGFALVYDRSNIVQSVLIPMLGIGFGQTINIQLPNCAASGTAGQGCNASAGAANPGASEFRLGVDGALPLPPFAPATAPVVPGRFGEDALIPG